MSPAGLEIQPGTTVTMHHPTIARRTARRTGHIHGHQPGGKKRDETAGQAPKHGLHRGGGAHNRSPPRKGAQYRTSWAGPHTWSPPRRGAQYKEDHRSTQTRTTSLRKREHKQSPQRRNRLWSLLGKQRKTESPTWSPTPIRCRSRSGSITEYRGPLARSASSTEYRGPLVREARKTAHSAQVHKRSSRNQDKHTHHQNMDVHNEVSKQVH